MTRRAAPDGEGPVTLGSAPDSPPDPSVDGEGAEAVRLRQLRTLLRGPEWDQILDLRDRLRDPTKYAEDVGRALPSAITHSRQRDERLGESLGPVVEESLKSTVRRDPQTFADAIFPVIGPAIRKAIATALAGLVQSLNQGLNHTFTPQGLRWRWEALRTGTSFGEVVLRHSMVYRVEQVFLIHRETGLLLEHVVADPTKVHSPEMVAAMLTAIQDFAKDSFRVQQGEALNAMSVGDVNVWVEEGPEAILAAAIRGVAPEALREEFQAALEDIHLSHGQPLEAFDGDASPFATARPRLEACLQYELSETKSGIPWAAIAVLAAVLLVLGWWLVPRIGEARRWKAYRALIEDQPGLVVTQEGTRDGKLFIAGLRDPLAADPVALLEYVGLDPERVVGRWEPYVALTPPIVLARARSRLRPPTQVTLTLDDGVLSATGPTPSEWVAAARRLAPTIPGVTRLRVDDPTLAERARAIEAHAVQFGLGSVEPEDAAVLEAIAGQIRELDSIARAQEHAVLIDIVGSTDDRGNVAANTRLAELRASRVVAMLTTLGVGQATLEARGSDPIAPRDTSEASRAELRRVALSVELVRRP